MAVDFTTEDNVLPWVREAYANLGVKETPGKSTTPVIQSWLHQLKAWWSDDETPWCGVFVAHCMSATQDLKGNTIPKNYMRAKEWLNFGEEVSVISPPIGSIIIFDRKDASGKSIGGHVAIIVGKDILGNLKYLGGNQGDSVSIGTVSPSSSRILGVRFPKGFAKSPLEVIKLTNKSFLTTSTNEA